MLSGLAAVIAGGYTFPGLTDLEFMGTHRYFGVPAPVYIVALLFIVGTVFLTRTRDGIRLMAVGGNAEAVRRSGIHSDRYKVLGFVISGICAALGGLVTTAITTEATPAASPSIIFSALTAVALAGVALTGGRGSLPRVLVGALILATIANGLTIRGVQPYWALVVDRCAAAGLARARAGHPVQRLQPADVQQPVRPQEAGCEMTENTPAESPPSSCPASRCTTATSGRCRASTSTSTPARSSVCSATTVPASPPCSR